MDHEHADQLFERAFERLVAIHNPTGATTAQSRRCWVCRSADAHGLLGLCEPCADRRLGRLLRVGQIASG